MKIRINLLWLLVPALLGPTLLLSNYRQHLLDFLPLLILLSCPYLMHLFMPHEPQRQASPRPRRTKQPRV